MTYVVTEPSFLASLLIPSSTERGDKADRATYYFYTYSPSKKRAIFWEKFLTYFPQFKVEMSPYASLLLYHACHIQGSWIRFREGSIPEWIPSFLLYSLKDPFDTIRGSISLDVSHSAPVSQPMRRSQHYRSWGDIGIQIKEVSLA